MPKQTARRRSRVPAGPSTSTARALRTVDRFFRASWREPPKDVVALRTVARRPMGTVPCVLYANFNTFWLGEHLQVMRQLARERQVPVAQLNRLAAAALVRHADRLSKWRLARTVRMLRTLATYFETEGARTHAEFVAVAEALMLAVDRINAWIDAAIPWSALDEKVTLCPPPG